MKSYLNKNGLNGSFTVEMSFIMPVILMVIMGCIMIVFYFHDKIIIAGAAYETAVVGGTKARNREGVSEDELQRMFKERVGDKCILFPGAKASISVTDEEIRVEASASRRGMKVSVPRKAKVTQPEKYIRENRKWKERLQ